MTSPELVFQKVFVREFFRTNMALLLIVAAFAFGFMRGDDHIHLGEAIVTMPVMLTIPFGIWAAYTLLIVDFNRRAIRSRENEFIFHFILLGHPVQRAMTLQTALVEFSPALMYGGFLVVLSTRLGLIIPVIAIPVALIMMVGFIAWSLRNSLISSDRQRFAAYSFWPIGIRMPRPSLIIPIEWIMRKQTFPFLGAKSCGFILLWATLHLYTTDIYDARLLGIGAGLGISLNISTILEWHFFDNVYFQLLKGLPYSIAQRWLRLLGSFVLLFLPEIGLVISHFPTQLNWIEGMQVILFMLSIPFVAYALSFRFPGGRERLTPYLFYGVMAIVLLIQSRIPIGLIAIVNFLMSAWMWKSFYRFEYLPKR